MRDQSPRPERRHCDDGGPIQPVWSSDLTPRPRWRPAPVPSRHPSFERTCHVVTDPAGKGHVATGAEPIQTLSDALGADGADALAAASTLPSASGISSGSPFPASANGSCTHRCPRHGLVAVDPLDLFHRQPVRPRGPPRTDRPRWFGRSHQLTRARSRRRPAPAGAESSMATLCLWLHNAASAQLPVGSTALDQEPLGSVSRHSALRGQLEESPRRCWPGGRARWRGRSLSQHVAHSSSRRPPCRTAAG